MSNRLKFSAEFKAEALKLVISSERPIVQIAVDIGVNEGTLGDWVRVWREEHPGADDPGPVEWAKYKALQVENSELKREIDFLGKVTFFTAKQTMNDYFVFIRAQKAFFPVDWMCQKLAVSRASHFRRPHQERPLGRDAATYWSKPSPSRRLTSPSTSF